MKLSLQVTTVNGNGAHHYFYIDARDNHDALVSLKALIKMNEELNYPVKLYFDYGYVGSIFLFELAPFTTYIEPLTGTTFKDILEWNKLDEYHVSEA